MLKNLLKYLSILMVIGWAVLVFRFSSEVSDESKLTSNNFTRIIFGDKITDEEIENLSFAIRKMAHFTLYMFGGISISICAILNIKSRMYIISYIFGTCYAITDEIHQLFVPGRACQIRDILIDSLGVLVGIVIVKYIKQYIFKRGERDEKSFIYSRY